MFWNHNRSAMSRTGSGRRGGLKLLYYGYATVNIRGAVSGRIYQFSRLHPLLTVDAEDAASILQMRLFREVR